MAKPTSTTDLPAGITLTAQGTYRVRWRVGGIAKGKTFRRLIDAKRHLAAVNTDLHRGVYVDSAHGRITLRSYADEWLAGAMNLGPGGRQTYRRDLDRYILPELEDVQLGRLDVTTINDYLSGELDRGLAPSTVHRHYRVIRRMCEVAVLTGRLPRNPCAAVTPPKMKRKEMRFLTVDQVDALAASISPARRGGDGPGRYRAWVLLAAYGGVRWSEGIGLRRQRVSANRVHVTEQFVKRDDGKWHREDLKTDASHRVVALPKVAAETLAAHLDTWADSGPDGLVFVNQIGRPVGIHNFTGMVFKPALERAGIDRRVRIHDLRHTAVALAIRAGAHPKAIQARMGHASITVTLDRYGHLFPEMDDILAEKLDALISETGSTSRPAT